MTFRSIEIKVVRRERNGDTFVTARVAFDRAENPVVRCFVNVLKSGGFETYSDYEHENPGQEALTRIADLVRALAS
jgi:hypothetical protein